MNCYGASLVVLSIVFQANGRTFKMECFFSITYFCAWLVFGWDLELAEAYTFQVMQANKQGVLYKKTAGFKMTTSLLQPDTHPFLLTNLM